MNASDIINRHFEKAAFNGYKPDDVDDYLREVSNEFSALQKKNAEYERKLEVLADKIREYREDEDALRDALLVAQKQGNAIVADSKANAEKLNAETKAAVEKLLSESKEKSEKMIKDADAYSKRTREDADNKAAKIVGTAQQKADEIKAAMDKQQTIQENILQETRREVRDYRDKVMELYRMTMANFEGIPEKCENDYVKKATAEYEKREAERRKQAADAAAKAQAKAKLEAAKTAMQEKNKKKDQVKNAASEKPAEGGEAPSEDEKRPEAAVSAEPIEEGDTDKTLDTNLPFFNPADNISHHDDLKFGKNNSKKK